MSKVEFGRVEDNNGIELVPADMADELLVALKELVAICRVGGHGTEAQRRYDAAQAAVAKAECH